MVKLRVGAISRNYFNMPLWVAVHQKMFEAEGLDVSVELFEPIDAVWQRLQDGRLDIALGVTEHIILDKEQGGHLEIIGGNVNRLPFLSSQARTFDRLRTCAEKLLAYLQFKPVVRL